MISNMERMPIYYKMDRERARQLQLKAQGKFRYTCSDPEMSHEECLAVLVEEMGELADAITVKSTDEMEEELIQVCAVAVAWLETLKDPTRKIFTPQWQGQFVKLMAEQGDVARAALEENKLAFDRHGGTIVNHLGMLIHFATNWIVGRSQ